MATENIVVKVRSDGARTVSRDINSIGQSAKKSASAMDTLKKAMKFLVAGAFVRQIASLSDKFESFAVMVGDSVEAQERVYKAAQATRSAMNDLGDIFGRVSIATKQYGDSMETNATITELFAKSAKLDQTSLSGYSTVISQITRSFSQAKVQVGLFSTLTRSAPALLQNLADTLGVTTGQLFEMMKAGELSGKELHDAFLDAGGTIDDQFKKVDATFGDVFTTLSNGAEKAVGDLSRSTGAAEVLNKLAKVLADNMQTLLTVTLAAAAAFLEFKLAPMIFSGVSGGIKNATRAMRGFTASMAANPIGLIAVAITAAIGLLYKFRNSIKLTGDGAATLSDLFVVTWNSIRDGISNAIKWFETFADSAKDTFIGRFVGYILDAGKRFFSMFDGLSLSLEGILRGIARFYDNVIGSIMGLVNGVKASLAQVGILIQNAFKKIINGVVSKVESGLNSIVDTLNKVSEKVGITFERVSLGRPFEIKKQAVGMGKAFVEGFDEGQAAQGGVLEKAVQNLSIWDKAQERANKRMAEASEKTDRQTSASNKLGNALSNTTNTVDTSTDSQVSKAEALAEVNRRLEIQRQALSLTSDQREVANKQTQIMQELQEQGITLTDKEVAGLKGKLQTMQQMNKVAQARDQLRQNTLGYQASQFGDQMTAMQQLQQGGEFTQDDAFAALGKMSQGAIGGGFDGQQRQLDQLRQYYDQVQQMREANLISERQAKAAEAQLWAKTQEVKLQQASDFFGMMAQLSKSKHSELAKIGKAAAIVEATINTYKAATAAYAAMAGIPVVGPALGATAAGAAITMGLEQVSAIQNAGLPGYKTGGDFMVGGTGAADSQTVAFRATPGEQVSIRTPGQQRQEKEAPEREQNVEVPVTIVQSVDPQATIDAMDTKAGSKVIQSQIASDPVAFKRALGI